MTDPNLDQDRRLAELFAKGADGLSDELLELLPRPWDAPPRPQDGGARPTTPYVIDKPLGAAAWVSLLLRQPLLLTGDPGVGKTRFAEKLADSLGIPFMRVQVKSTTNGRDLLYTFDDLARFRDATIAGALARQVKGDSSAGLVRPLISYVTLQGLGRAIVRAAGADAEVELDSGHNPTEVFGADFGDSRTLRLGDIFKPEFSKDRPSPLSVVLIDELDKASRDTPNDLLAEIESMTFRIDELGFQVTADPQCKPIVVITSNAERNLPDAFLRRCIFHHIATPDKELMCRIVATRLGDGLDPKGKLIESAWLLFNDVSKAIPEKKPGTAEFIAFVSYLQAAGLTTNDTLRRDSDVARHALRIVSKTKTDLTSAENVLGNDALSYCGFDMSADGASLPTLKAVDAFSEQIRSLPNFDDLFDRLVDKHIAVGTDRRLRAMSLLTRLSRLGVRFDNAAELRGYLLPVLARSAHDEREIGPIFDAWLGLPNEKSGATTGAPAPRTLKQLETMEVRNRSLIFGLGAGVIGILAIFGYFIFLVFGQGVPPSEAITQITPPAAAPVLPLPEFVVPSPAFRGGLERLISGLALAVPVLLLGFTALSWRRNARARLSRRVGDWDLLDSFVMTVAKPGWFRFGAARLAFDRLKRNRWFESDRVDIARSVAATIRAAGRPVIRRQRQRERPQYVLLVDHAARGDHADYFADLVESAMRQADIVYSRYDYTDRPDRLYPVRGSVPGDEQLPFSVVASRHAGDRVIVLGSGARFFEEPRIRRDQAGQRIVVKPGTHVPELLHLREFAARFLLTPTPRAAWGITERYLAELGFAVIPADVSGIEGISAIVASDTGEPTNDPRLRETRRETFLDRLQRDSLRLLSNIPPPKEDVDRLVRDLRTWSRSPEVFLLLASIGVFPRIDPSFTIEFAGHILKSREGGLEPTLFGALQRLPWLSEGRMPDWLRIALVNALDEDQKQRLRTIQLAMLAKMEPAQGGVELRSVDELVAELEVARSTSPAKLKEFTDRLGGAGEKVFLAVLRGEALDAERDVLHPEAPAAMRERMEAAERKTLLQLRLTVVGLALLALVLQPMIAHAFSFISAGVDNSASLLGDLIDTAWIEGAGSIGLGLTLLALMLWTTEFLREKPLLSLGEPANDLIRFEGGRLSFDLHLANLFNERMFAMGATFFSILGIAHPTGSPASYVSRVHAITAMAVCAWVMLVRPHRFWRSPCADDALRERLSSTDALGGTLATCAIGAIIGSSFIALLLLMSVNISDPGRLFVAALCFGVLWSVGLRLMRRWALGGLDSSSAARPMLDVAFGTTVILVLTSAFDVLPEPTWGIFLVSLGPAGALYLNARAVLGARRSSTYWRRSLMAYALAFAIYLSVVGALMVVLVLYIDSTLASTDPEFLTASLLSSASVGAVLLFIAAIIVTAILAAFARTRSRQITFAQALSDSPKAIATAIAVALIPYLMIVDAMREDIIDGFELIGGLRAEIMSIPYFHLPSLPFGRFEGLLSLNTALGSLAVAAIAWLIWFPLVLSFWPVFRFIGPAAALATPDRPDPTFRTQPWTTVAGGQWLAVPALWLISVVWNQTPNTFSLAPLALPVAVGFAWVFGKRVYLPLAVGALPFLFDILWSADARSANGIWPAVAILFWAKFTADSRFRADLLRRERMTWLDAALTVGLLSVSLNWSRGQIFFPPGALLLDPSWMLVTVGFVVGSSRMARGPLALLAILSSAAFVVVSGLMTDLSNVNLDERLVYSYAFGLAPADCLALLLALFLGRSWPILAGGTQVSLSGVAQAPLGTRLDLLLNRRSAHGFIFGIVFGWLVLFSGLALAAAVLSARLQTPIAPGAFGMMGLLAAFVFGLWAWNMRRIYPVLLWALLPLPLLLLLSYALSSTTFISTLEYFGYVELLSPNRLGSLGIGGFWVCVAGYAAFGFALRFVTERGLTPVSIAASLSQFLASFGRREQSAELAATS